MDIQTSKTLSKFQSIVERILKEGADAPICEMKGMSSSTHYLNGILRTEQSFSYSEYPDFSAVKSKGESLVRVRFPSFNKCYWGLFTPTSDLPRFKLAFYWPDVQLAGYQTAPLEKIHKDWKELFADCAKKVIRIDLKDGFKNYLATLAGLFEEIGAEDHSFYAEPLFWYSYREFRNSTDKSLYAEEKNTLLDKFKNLGGVGDDFISYFYEILNRHSDELISNLRKKTGDILEARDGSNSIGLLMDRASKIKDFLTTDGRMVIDETMGRIREVQMSQSKTHEFYRDVDYLTVVTSMPFEAEYDYKKISLRDSIANFDRSHFGMKAAKRSLAEALALKVRGINNSEVICLVGPPGTGKTTLANSLARSIGIDSRSVALGGVNDESVIRGISRFYVGASSGRIIKEWRSCSVKNPVVILDEIDKLSNGGRGSPAAALLELLDPEQNRNFIDQYIGFPIDLSKVFWICTANYLEQIPIELRDRILMINVPGYTEQEQIEILHNYLIPKYRLQWNIDIDVSHDLNEFFVSKNLTGVRDMEHNLQRICKSMMLDGELGEPFGFDEAYISKVLNKKLVTSRKPIGFTR